MVSGKLHRCFINTTVPSTTSVPECSGIRLIAPYSDMCFLLSGPAICPLAKVIRTTQIFSDESRCAPHWPAFVASASSSCAAQVLAQLAHCVQDQPLGH